MTQEEWQEILLNPDNWPDGEDLPSEWRLFYWATKEIYTDTARLFDEIRERGLDELFNDVMIDLGYQVIDDPSGKKEISLSRKEQIHSVRRVATFILDAENVGRSARLLASELRVLGYHAQLRDDPM